MCFPTRRDRRTTLLTLNSSIFQLLARVTDVEQELPEYEIPESFTETGREGHPLQEKRPHRHVPSASSVTVYHGTLVARMSRKS